MFTCVCEQKSAKGPLSDPAGPDIGDLIPQVPLWLSILIWRPLKGEIAKTAHPESSGMLAPKPK